MSTVTTVVCSPRGSTARLAAAVRTGAAGSGCDTTEIVVADGRHADDDIEQLAESDAVVFCSPTYLGAPPAQLLTWMQHCERLRAREILKDTLAAGLTSGIALDGGRSATLTTLLTYALQHSMLWVGLDFSSRRARFDGRDVVANPAAYRLGVAAVTTDDGPDDDGLVSAHLLGCRLGNLLTGARGPS